MLSSEVSKHASTEASLASWLTSQGTGQTRRARIAAIQPTLCSLPSYKSRRSFGLSSVFPSVSRHVGPNPDAEIRRADAAAELRQSLLPLSVSAVKSHRAATSTSGRNFKIKSSFENTQTESGGDRHFLAFPAASNLLFVLQATNIDIPRGQIKLYFVL